MFEGVYACLRGMFEGVYVCLRGVYACLRGCMHVWGSVCMFEGDV